MPWKNNVMSDTNEQEFCLMPLILFRSVIIKCCPCFLVLPQCRSDQRLTYGATRKNSAGVSCFVEANPYPHNFRWQIQPNKKKGRTKHAETVDIPSDDFTLEQDHSVLQVYNINLTYVLSSEMLTVFPCFFPFFSTLPRQKLITGLLCAGRKTQLECRVNRASSP